MLNVVAVGQKNPAVYLPLRRCAVRAKAKENKRLARGGDCLIDPPQAAALRTLHSIAR